MRHYLLAVAVLGSLAAAGCSDHAASSAQNAAASSRPVASTSSFLAGARVPGRLASLPDRGDMIAYDHARAPIARGAYTLYPAQLSEARALRAVAEGGMTITAPDGRPIRLQYVDRVEHTGGNWTWIGRPAGSSPGQEALITFGQKAVFGSIPDGNGEPLQVTTAGGQVWVVQADARKLAAQGPDPMPRASDMLVPHAAGAQPMAGPAPKAAAPVAMAQASPISTTAQAAVVSTSPTTTVDVVVGYTNGFATRLGGQSQAVTRLQYLVDIGNQAYIDSQVAGRIRMVAAVQVNYPDATSNQTSLFELSGLNCTTDATVTSPRTPDTGATCTPAGVPGALQPLVSARAKYGADLVTLVRIFSDPQSGSCGVGWLIGAGQAPITQADAKYGVSLVSDTSGNTFPSNNITCREEYLVHELGHNMGLQHDRQTAAGSNNTLDPIEYGAFPYSFGYSTDSTHGNFYTIMSLRRTGQTGFKVFSNPDLTTCNSLPCGVADQADNARALRQTMPIIASFAVPVSDLWLRGDFDGDGKADILWRNNVTGAGTIWLGASTSTQQSVATVNNPAWEVVGVGDFDGDRKADILWRNNLNGANTIWLAGNNATQQAVPTMNNFSWTIMGIGDFNGDGKADILWRNTASGANAIWLGANPSTQQSVASVNNFAWEIVGIGDFNGDGKADILWRNMGTGAGTIWLSGNAATQMPVATVNNFDWKVVGVGDFNGDGRADILWRNISSGANTIWLSGSNTTQQAVSTVNNFGWSVVGVGDFNGDGKADIEWQNMNTGANLLWLSGNSATQQPMTTVNNFAWFIAG